MSHQSRQARPEANRTDESNESGYSLSESLKSLSIGAGMYLFNDDELKTASPEYILRRMLSTKSYITTTSSLAEDNQDAQGDVRKRRFDQIGKGQCGTVHAFRGTTKVIKLPNSSEKCHELYEEAKMHQLVKEAFENVTEINLPEFRAWVDPDTKPFWPDHALYFAPHVNTPNLGLVSDRIFPLPLPVREAIVDALCSKTIQSQKTDFLKQSENKDCLMRLYLGRRNVPRPEYATLRNFPLHADDMETMGLDTTMYATVMARALAVMHWRAGVDANDVEFVLGSAPEISKNPGYEAMVEADMYTASQLFQINFRRRSVAIWLLDFNQCTEVDIDKNPEAALKQLVDGFWWNDPYYPRPDDKQLWKVFSEHYLAVSATITQGDMPRDFIKAVEEKGKKGSVSGLFGQGDEGFGKQNEYRDNLLSRPVISAEPSHQ